MNTPKILVASAVALASLAALVLAIVLLLTPHPDAEQRGSGTFGARFQPHLDARAGIGSTRDLTPVDLNAAKPTPPAAAQPATQGGRHASAANPR